MAMKRIYQMTQNVTLAGTDLTLREGELVTVEDATNLPQGGYFVQPAYRPWAYGGPDDSIHCDGHEFQFFAVNTDWKPPIYN